jgi:hypothetical protein
LSETFLILRRIQRDIIINVYKPSCKLPVILSRLKSNLNFPNTFSKNIKISNFMKTLPVGGKLFHADRQTGMAKLKSLFAILQTCLIRIINKNT